MSPAFRRIRNRGRGRWISASRRRESCLRHCRRAGEAGRVTDRNGDVSSFDLQLSLRIDRIHDILDNPDRYPAWPPCRHALLRLELRALERGIPA